MALGTPIEGRPKRGLLRALLLGFCMSAPAAEPLAVTAVRYWSLGDVTRIAIQTTGPFQYHADRLTGPSRAFFDLFGARPRLNTNAKGIHVIAVGDARVKQIRVAETQPAVTRVVIDLEEGDFEVIPSQLTLPDRLLVEVRAKGVQIPTTTLSSSGVHRIPTADSDAKRVAETAAPAAKPDQQASAAAVAPAPSEPLGKTVEPKASAKGAEKAAEPSQLAKAAPPKEIPPAIAKPADRNHHGGRSLTRVLGLKIRRVVIDPGHGGHDHGATSPSGLTEKELVLDVAKRLGTLITRRMGSEVYYTRTEDEYVPLEERPQIANAKKADIFISIHANSSPVRSAAGAETYYLSFTTSRAALEVAARENASSDLSIHDLRDLIQKIALKDKVEESREFAAKLQSSLNKVTSTNTAAKNRGVKKAPFVVLIGASMPSVLAEIGFLSNSREEALLRRSEYRDKIAEALFQGLAHYADTLSHFEVAQSGVPTGE